VAYGVPPEAGLGERMYTVYILRSDQFDRYYIGSSATVYERLDAHNRGSVQSTKPYRPWKLVYQEQFNNHTDALVRERQIKRYKRGEAFDRLLKHGGVA
jgi:putative endonuclease